MAQTATPFVWVAAGVEAEAPTEPDAGYPIGVHRRPLDIDCPPPPPPQAPKQEICAEDAITPSTDKTNNNFNMLRAPSCATLLEQQIVGSVSTLPEWSHAHLATLHVADINLDELTQ